MCTKCRPMFSSYMIAAMTVVAMRAFQNYSRAAYPFKKSKRKQIVSVNIYHFNFFLFFEPTVAKPQTHDETQRYALN